MRKEDLSSPVGASSSATSFEVVRAGDLAVGLKSRERRALASSPKGAVVPVAGAVIPVAAPRLLLWLSRLSRTLAAFFASPFRDFFYTSKYAVTE